MAAFDPALPEDHSLIVAGVLRDQFNGLKSLIDGITTVNAATVDAVTTLSPGQPAEASVAVEGNELHFSFGVPQGYDGQQGQQGNDGPQGPPFAQAVVDGVTTLTPGEPATVGVMFDGTYVHFSFGIPMGYPGQEGPTGPPGEVTTAELNAAITDVVAGSSANSNAVDPIPFSASPEYDQAQFQAMIDKVNELIAALRRS